MRSSKATEPLRAPTTSLLYSVCAYVCVCLFVPITISEYKEYFYIGEVKHRWGPLLDGGDTTWKILYDTYFKFNH